MKNREVYCIKNLNWKPYRFEDNENYPKLNGVVEIWYDCKHAAEEIKLCSVPIFTEFTLDAIRNALKQWLNEEYITPYGSKKPDLHNKKRNISEIMGSIFDELDSVMEQEEEYNPFDDEPIDC